MNGAWFLRAMAQDSVIHNSPLYDTAEQTVFNAVQWLRLGVETLGALVIAIGFLIGVWMFLRVALKGETSGYNGVRLILARYLALALEFQLAGDILSTAIAPSWGAIGKLAAIAVIRTGLNYFLSREMEAFHAPDAEREARVAT